MKNIGQDLNGVCAVYCIYNSVNECEYIGSSSNLYNRMLKHRALLRHGKHPNWKLQEDWDKFGEDCFDYRIVEECSSDELMRKEDDYIKASASSYNIAYGTIDYTYPKDTCKRISDGRKKGFADGNIKAYQKKKIYKYDLDGNLVAEYDCIKQAALREGINRSSINRCLNGTYTQMNGFRWSLTKKENIGKYVKPTRVLPNKYIYIVDDGNSVKKFDGCKACADYFGVSTNSIEQVIRNGNVYRKKYKITKVCRSHE